MINKVMHYRRQKGFTQEEIAKQIDITLTQYRNIEKNRTKNPGIYIVLKIAKALNVPVESLFTLEDV